MKPLFRLAVLFCGLAALNAAPIGRECTTPAAKAADGVVTLSVRNNKFCMIRFKLKEAVTFTPEQALTFEDRLTAPEPKPIVAAQLRFGKKLTWSGFPADNTWRKAKVLFYKTRFEKDSGGGVPQTGDQITGLQIYGRTQAPADMTLELRNIQIAVEPLEFQDPEKPAGEFRRRPEADAAVHVTPAAFVWPVQGGAASYTLEYARDAAFTRDAVKVDDLRYNAYCSDRVMAPGDWYWRVRFRTKDGRTSSWSSVQKFTIAPDAKPIVMPAREALFARIPAGHPRLFFRPEQIAEFKARFSGDLKAEYDRMIKRCDDFVKQEFDTSEPGFHKPISDPEGAAQWRAAFSRTTLITERMSDLAFGWMMTGKPEYLAKAKQLLAAINAWAPSGATGMAHNDECGMPILRNLARTYTFAHDALTPEEREATLKTMRARGADALRRICPRLLTQPFDSHANRIFYFLAEAGLAFHGDLPEADEWLYFPMLYFYCNYPAWGDLDGGWHEGSIYYEGYMYTFFTWGETMKNVLGLPPLVKPFFANAGHYLMYHEPPGSSGYGWGDLTDCYRPRKGAAVMRIMAAQAGNPYWAWYAEEVAEEAKNYAPAYISILRAAAPKLAGKAPTDIPASRLFRGNGQAAMNTSLVSAADSVQVLFKCGAQYGSRSHGYELPNTFIVNAYGDRLLIRAGTRDSYGSNFHRNYMWESKSQNNILVDGQGMEKHVPKPQGKMLFFSTTPELDVVKGEGGDAFAAQGVNSYTREIRFRKPDAILVIDRIEAEKPVRLDWLLHAKVPFGIAGQHDINLATEHAACTVDFLYPEKLAVTQTDQFDPPITAPKLRATFIEHHLTATPAEKTAKACFVTLIRPYRKGGAVPAKGMLTQTEKGFTVRVPLADGKVWETLIER